MRRATLNGADLIKERLQVGGQRWKAALVTLTYRPGVAWAGRHVSECLDHMRKYLGA